MHFSFGCLLIDALAWLHWDPALQTQLRIWSGLSKTARATQDGSPNSRSQTFWRASPTTGSSSLASFCQHTDGKQKTDPHLSYWVYFLNLKEKQLFFFFLVLSTNTSKLCHDFLKDSGLLHFELWKLDFLWPLKITGFGKGIQDTVWGSKTLSYCTPHAKLQQLSSRRGSPLCLCRLSHCTDYKLGRSAHVCRLNSLLPTSLLRKFSQSFEQTLAFHSTFRKDRHFKFCELFWAQSRCKKFLRKEYQN